jgi:type IV pilus assembly protein PilZ
MRRGWREAKWTTEMSTAAPNTPRPSVIQLAIKEKAALYAAYIPLFADGGVFIPTTRDYQLGDDVYVLLSLPDDPQRYPVAGKVAWVTPARAAANRTQGVGVRFPADEKSRLLKIKIEEILGGHLASERPTQTI